MAGPARAIDSPSVSSSAASTPSSDVPLIRPMTFRTFVTVLSTLADRNSAAIGNTHVRVPLRIPSPDQGARPAASVHRRCWPRRADADAARRRIYRLRLHGTESARREPDADHGPAPAAADGT